MRYECPLSRKISRPPTIRNWINTISGMEYLWTKLYKKGFTSLIPRNFNQDAVENFFSLIRSHGIRNINPTCTSFVSSFKSLIVNNFLSTNSVGSNCESNLSNSGLDNLRSFLTCQHNETKINEVQPTLYDDISNISSDSSNLATYARAYVCGYVAGKLLNIVKDCDLCFKNLVSTTVLPQHELIILKQNARKQLLKPNSAFMICFDSCHIIISKYLPILCLQNNVFSKLKDIVKNSVNFDKLICSQHPNVCDTFLTIFIHFAIFCWTNEINQILRGRDTRFKPEKSSDKIKVMGYNYRQKHKK